MKHDRRHPLASSVLDPTNVGTLRTALERLRDTGLSEDQAAAEVVRKGMYDWVDAESDDSSSAARRLRPLKND